MSRPVDEVADARDSGGERTEGERWPDHRRLITGRPASLAGLNHWAA
jgi:hypothetical protein